MKDYTKLIVAAFGMLAMILKDYANVTITTETIDNISTAIVTLWGVWGLRNG